MDPTTLETHRETRMAGQIRSNTFSAHYRIVTETHGSAGRADAPQQQQQHHHHHGHHHDHHDNGRAQHQQHQQAPRWWVANGGGGASAAESHVTGNGDGNGNGNGNGRSAAGATTTTTRRLVTFSNEFGYSGASAVFYEFDETGQLLHETRHMLPVRGGVL
jgi:all-trans-8'-apo-beta-carotenal 15,15'-oxygenase